MNLLEYDAKSRIILKIDPARENLVIILSPRLEEWLLEALREAGINRQNIMIPHDQTYYVIC